MHLSYLRYPPARTERVDIAERVIGDGRSRVLLRRSAISQSPMWIGATGTMFIEVEGVDALHGRLKGTVTIAMPLVTQFYGMREFAIVDPDGYVITFAERVPQG